MDILLHHMGRISFIRRFHIAMLDTGMDIRLGRLDIDHSVGVIAAGGGSWKQSVKKRLTLGIRPQYLTDRK